MRLNLWNYGRTSVSVIYLNLQMYRYNGKSEDMSFNFCWHWRNSDKRCSRPGFSQNENIWGLFCPSKRAFEVKEAGKWTFYHPSKKGWNGLLTWKLLWTWQQSKYSPFPGTHLSETEAKRKCWECCKLKQKPKGRILIITSCQLCGLGVHNTL